MAVAGVPLFAIPVTDRDRAGDSWVDVPGVAVAADTETGSGRRWVQLSAPGGPTSITPVTWSETVPAGSHRGVVLSSDDVDADGARRAARGVAGEGEIQEARWGRPATFDDAHGDGLVLQGAAPGA